VGDDVIHPPAVFVVGVIAPYAIAVLYVDTLAVLVVANIVNVGEAPGLGVSVQFFL
jgi:hypothetical protein